jgi:hypothetical protein
MNNTTASGLIINAPVADLEILMWGRDIERLEVEGWWGLEEGICPLLKRVRGTS